MADVVVEGHSDILPLLFGGFIVYLFYRFRNSSAEAPSTTAEIAAGTAGTSGADKCGCGSSPSSPFIPPKASPSVGTLDVNATSGRYIGTHYVG